MQQNGTQASLVAHRKARAIGISARRSEQAPMDDQIPAKPVNTSSADDSVLWPALLRDSSCRVAVLDQSGSIEHCNEAFAEQFTSGGTAGPDGPPPHPKQLAAIYPPNLAEERLRSLR